MTRRVPFVTDRKGNEMTPIYVLAGVIVVVVITFLLANQFLLKETDYPSDNGVYLDEEVVDYGEPFAVLEVRDFGTIRIELNDEKAPITTANFVKLCNQGFYNGLTFHRVIQDFMIQGGDPTGDGTGGPGYTLESEADNGLKNDRGAIAMAKRGDETRMSGSQFYIVQAEDGANHLDGEHTVFGKVVSGMDVVDDIAAVATDSNDRPINSIVIVRAYIEYE